MTAWCASTNVLNLMQAIIGSQWRSVSRGMVCVYLGTLNIRRAAAFWISCRGLMAGAGRPVSRELQGSPGGTGPLLGRGAEDKEMSTNFFFFM